MVIFPYSAVVGNDALKLALLLSVIDPKIGGLLIKGFRGSAKSTLARAVAEIAYIGPDKFVLLPLGADEERLVGSIDLQSVLDDGQVEFRPGLLHKAHQGILYVDEVNLLSDALVDLLLDVCASGVNTIERDGISKSHPAHFVLIGTMNPDEGELRPQMLDRFGMCVELDQPLDVEQRMQVVERRISFDSDPAAFLKRYRGQQLQLLEQVQLTQQRLANISISPECQRYACEICYQADVEGVRADITLRRAAMAYAAWQALDEVSFDCIDTVAEWVLVHRRRLDKHSASSSAEKNRDTKTDSVESDRDNTNHGPGSNDTPNLEGDWGAMPPQSVPVGNARNIDKVLSSSGTNAAEKKNNKTDITV